MSFLTSPISLLLPLHHLLALHSILLQIFSGTPTTGAGTTTITLTGTDGNGASNTTTFDFIVRTNSAPVFTVSPIPDQMFNIDQNVAFTIAVNDPDVGDTTTTIAIDPPTFMNWA